MNIDERVNTSEELDSRIQKYKVPGFMNRDDSKIQILPNLQSRHQLRSKSELKKPVTDRKMPSLKSALTNFENLYGSKMTSRKDRPLKKTASVFSKDSSQYNLKANIRIEEGTEPITEVPISNSTTTRKKISQVNHGHYTAQKLKSLNWLKKQNIEVFYKRDLDRQNNKLKSKQEIYAKYNQMSKVSGIEDGLYKYSVLRGNNSELVRRVLETRENWNELPQGMSSLFSFKWAPISKAINFESLSSYGQKQMVNHFEKHG